MAGTSKYSDHFAGRMHPAAGNSISGGIGTTPAFEPNPGQTAAAPTSPLPFPTPPPTAQGEHPTPRPIQPSLTPPVNPTQTDPPADQTQHVVLLPFIPYNERRVIAERVLIISIDGLRPEGIYNEKTGAVNAPFLFSLSQKGVVDWSAQTVRPSTTLPGHTSMLTGYGVTKHGVDIPGYQDLLKLGPHLAVPTIFDYAQDFGFRTVLVAGKKKMNYFHRPGSLDAVHIYVEKNDDERFDADIASQARKFMRDGFGVMFIHFPDTDSVGHAEGWLSKRYMGTVRRVDKTIKTIFEKLASLGYLETTLVIITADHAGNDVGHMGSGPLEMTIPWIMVGPQVRPGLSLSGIQIMDTAATTLWALGIPLPPDLDGRVVREAFQ